MSQDIARDKLCLIEEHIPNPDRFAVCLCTRDNGFTFGVYIDDLFTSASAVLDEEFEANELVAMLQLATQPLPPMTHPPPPPPGWPGPDFNGEDDPNSSYLIDDDDDDSGEGGDGGLPAWPSPPRWPSR